MKDLWIRFKKWKEQRWVKEWQRTRAKGENHFAISSGLVMALVGVVAGFIINWRNDRLLLIKSEHPISDVIFLIIHLAIGFAAGWAVAEITWHRNERSYKKWEEKQVSARQDRLH